MLIRFIAFVCFSCLGDIVYSQGVKLPELTSSHVRVQYPPSSVAGELPYGVSYTLWMPPGVKTLRGIIVHQHGCGEGACKAGQTASYDLHWQALAAKHECALMGPSYEQPEKEDCQLWCDPRNGSGKKFLQALDELAQKSKHPEIKTVPWALWGHSGGGTWVGTMLMLHPERIAAVWLRSGIPRIEPKEGAKLPALEIPDAALKVPAMYNLGAQEGVTVKEGRFAGVWKGAEQFFTTMRKRGALIGLSVDPKSSHDCGNQRYLAVAWFDACLTARLPRSVGEPLLPMPTDTAWLAALLGESSSPASEFIGNVGVSVWLPNQKVAVAWQEYTKDANIADTTPPAPAQNVEVKGNEIRWDAIADLESGIAQFIILRDGKELARVPDKLTSPFGRPIFQKNSYSDTPSQPLASMSFVDGTAKSDEKHDYSVVVVNSVGLQSEPSKSH